MYSINMYYIKTIIVSSSISKPLFLAITMAMKILNFFYIIYYSSIQFHLSSLLSFLTSCLLMR